ncbi:hypothetical protein AAHA92_33892 [Salvia divinorum]|uniref:Uncharacterized protein n=1 Tax=Salvia divinorum TaxID=28513 RepID=A0ABD1FH50_SALDI
MDFGGVGCITCLKRLEVHSGQSLQIPSNISNDTVSTNGIKDVDPVIVDSRIDDDKFSSWRLLQLTKVIGAIDGCSDNSKPREGVQNIYEPLAQPSLNFSLTKPSSSSATILPFPGGIAEGSEQCKVTFSHIEPGGQFVIGCRKAINNGDAQDSQTLASTSGDSPGGTSISGTNGNLLSNGGKTSGDSLQQSISEKKKKAKNIKNKRFLMHTDDATELRISWEEAQELLRPFPTAEPTVVVEDHVFEEFEDQLAQCEVA